MSIVIRIEIDEPRFVCTGCGKCCYGGQGAALLWHEVERYKQAFPDVELSEVMPGTMWTIPKNEADGCIHLEEDGKTCSLHNSGMKPRLCEGWPKAPDSPRQDECPGIWFV